MHDSPAIVSPTASADAAHASRTRSTAATSELTPARLVALLAVLFVATHVCWLAVEPACAGLETTRIVVARTMERTGDWIVPRQHGEVYLAKPPLGYWLIALGSWPFGGVTVWSARLVAASCALLVALATALFARREVGGRTGLMAGVSVLVSALYLDEGLRAEIEAPLALFTLVAIVALYRSVWSERRRFAWLALSGSALGGAALVKGPVALLVFALAASGLVVGARSMRRRASWHTAIALCVSVVVGGAWLWAVLRRVDVGPAMRTMWDETFQRVHAAGATNREPFWYYGPALVAALAPTSVCLPAIVAARSLLAVGDERRRALLGLLIGWSVVSAIVLSASQGKEARYLIASLPGWAILVGWSWCEARAKWLTTYRRVVLLGGRAIAFLIPVGVLAASWALRPDSWSLACLASVLSATAVWLWLRPASSRSLHWRWSALVVGALGARLFWATVLMPGRSESYPVERMGADIAAQVGPGEVIVELGEYSSFVELHADRPMRVAWTPADLDLQLAREPRARFVLARDRHLPTSGPWTFVETGAWSYGSSRFHLLRVVEPNDPSRSGRTVPASLTTGRVAETR